MRVAPVGDADAEDLLKGWPAALQGQGECSPGLPILLDDDLDLCSEPRVVSERLPYRGQGEGAVSLLLAETDGAQPAQKAAEMRRRQAKRFGQCPRSPAPRAHLFGKPELHRGIEQGGLVIGLDRPAESVLQGVLSGLAHRSLAGLHPA